MSKYLTSQTKYVEFWKQQSESVPAEERKRACNKYRDETNHYRQLWSLLTSQTSNNAEDNLPKVDCVSFRERMRIEAMANNRMSKLNEETAVAALARVERVKREFDLHAIMAERQACYYLGRSGIRGNKEKKCQKWDPKYPADVPSEVFPYEPATAALKLMPLSEGTDSITWERFTKEHKKLSDVFYGDGGLFMSDLYGKEARQLHFQCKQVISPHVVGAGWCCPSRCMNCDEVHMNEGIMNDKFTDIMKKEILAKCTPRTPRTSVLDEVDAYGSLVLNDEADH